MNQYLFLQSGYYVDFNDSLNLEKYAHSSGGSFLYIYNLTNKIGFCVLSDFDTPKFYFNSVKYGVKRDLKISDLYKNKNSFEQFLRNG